MTIVSASTDQGEAGYLKLDWHALADEIGPPQCVALVEVQHLIHALRGLGFDSTHEAAEVMADQLAEAAVVAEWNQEWSKIAVLAHQATTITTMWSDGEDWWLK